MGGFSRYILLISFLFLLYEKTITQININKSLLKISTDITADYCRKQHSPDFDVKESYNYITDEIRYDLCKTEYNGFDPDGFIAQEYKQCLGPKHMYQTYYNPCEVVCPFRPDMLLQDLIFLEDIDELKCDEFIKTYTNLTRLFWLRDVNQQCGPNHFCNALGCCAKLVPTESTTVLEFIAKSDGARLSALRLEYNLLRLYENTSNLCADSLAPSDFAINSRVVKTTVKIEPSIQPSTQPSIPTLSIETKKHILTTQSLSITTKMIEPVESCNINNIGILYKYPKDPTNRKYYRCVLKAELMTCPIDQIFDEKLLHCIQTPTTLPTTTVSTTKAPVIDWSKYFHCTVEGFFRNPYDCKKFYRCYKNTGDNRRIWFSPFDCPKDQYFDEPQETCIPINDYISQRGVCKVEPLPTLSPHNIY